MSTPTIDKEIVKAAIIELFAENPNLIKDALKEILYEDNMNSGTSIQDLIEKNFKRFDKTFRALA